MQLYLKMQIRTLPCKAKPYINNIKSPADSLSPSYRGKSCEGLMSLHLKDFMEIMNVEFSGIKRKMTKQIVINAKFKSQHEVGVY